MQTIEQLGVKGKTWKNPYRQVYLFIAGIFFALFLLLLGGYLYLILHLNDPYLNFMITAFVILLLFAPYMALVYFLQKAMDSIRKVVVGDEGLLFFRDTTVPYFIPWGDVWHASVLLNYRFLILKMEDGRQWRFKLPRPVLREVERVWNSKNLERIIEDSRGNA